MSEAYNKSAFDANINFVIFLKVVLKECVSSCTDLEARRRNQIPRCWAKRYNRTRGFFLQN